MCPQDLSSLKPLASSAFAVLLLLPSALAAQRALKIGKLNRELPICPFLAGEHSPRGTAEGSMFPEQHGAATGWEGSGPGMSVSSRLSGAAASTRGGACRTG